MAEAEKEKKEKEDKKEGSGDDAEEPMVPQVDLIDVHHFEGLVPKEIYQMFERQDMDVYRDTFGGLEGFLEKLKTNVDTGFNSEETLEKRTEQFGINATRKKDPVTFLDCLAEAYSDHVILLLLGAAFISIILGLTLPNPHSKKVEYATGWIEGTAIIFSVLVVTLTGSINNYQKAKQFEALEKEVEAKAVTVMRDGKRQIIMSDELLVGDIYLITDPGVELTVDAILISGQSLRTNEATVTGEPDLKLKTPDKNVFLLSGSFVEEGNGVVLVVAVGESSYRGRQKIATSSADTGDTPLQEHLTELADNIGKVSIVGALLLLFALCLKEVILIFGQDHDAEATRFLSFVIIAVTIIAVAIPEGLPLAVAISLAWSMKAMMSEQCLVRVLASCETMGAATAICSDKTGTLTLNQMTTVQGVIGWEEFVLSGYKLRRRVADATFVDRGTGKEEDPDGPKEGVASGEPDKKDGDGDKKEGEDKATKKDEKPKTTVDPAAMRAQFKVQSSVLDLFCRAIAVNSTAREQAEQQKKDEDGEKNDDDKKNNEPMANNNKDGAEPPKMVWMGNITEQGMLRFIKSIGCDYEAEREAVKGRSNQYPFSSKKKRMTTLVKPEGAASTDSSSSGPIMAYIKGASERILADSTLCIDPATGEPTPITDEIRETYAEQVQWFASRGNRTMGVSVSFDAEIEGGEFPDDEPDHIPNTVFLGILGIEDPPRPEVPTAVARCQSAGVTVRMVTGDNIDTAKAIAEKCGIYNPNNGYDVAMEGRAFRKLVDSKDPAVRKELLEMIPRLRILARSSPEDKKILVGLLKDELDEVVGVTGDGTNDAPALKLANVGFAMKTGTEIAQGASDMVLLDDNFATVVTAIRWGRAVNDNIKKFLQYQLAINVAGCSLTVVGSLYSAESKEPLAAVQLLWLNLIMDTLAALSLSTERPEESSLDRRPVYQQSPLINARMVSFIAIHGTYQFVIVFLLLLFGHKWFHTVDESKQGCDNVLPLNTNESFYNATSNMTEFRLIESHARQWCRYRCEYVGGKPHEVDGHFVCEQGEVHSTILFNTFIWFQVFNSINARKIYGEINAFEGLIDRSKMMMGVFLIIIILQVLVVEVADRFMKTTGLRWDYWLICLGFGISELPLGLIVRLLPFENKIPEEILEKERIEAETRERLKPSGTAVNVESSHPV